MSAPALADEAPVDGDIWSAFGTEALAMHRQNGPAAAEGVGRAAAAASPSSSAAAGLPTRDRHPGGGSGSSYALDDDGGQGRPPEAGELGERAAEGGEGGGGGGAARGRRWDAEPQVAGEASFESAPFEVPAERGAKRIEIVLPGGRTIGHTFTCA
jgi:hypothetical protein